MSAQLIDTAPKDGSFILVWCAEWRDPPWHVARWENEPDADDGGFWWVLDEVFSDDISDPTHWAPLPDEPQIGVQQ